jgi:hypothetical protein
MELKDTTGKESQGEKREAKRQQAEQANILQLRESRKPFGESQEAESVYPVR